MIQCCGKDMLVSGRWYHCEMCHKRLVDIPYGEDREVLAELISDYLQEFEPTWKEFCSIIHELWREGLYDGYEPKVPETWIRENSILK